MVTKCWGEGEPGPARELVYKLDERETRLLWQYQYATYGYTAIPVDATSSVLYALPDVVEQLELTLFLAGLNIKEDLTK